MDPSSDEDVVNSNAVHSSSSSASSSSIANNSGYDENLTYSWMEKYLRDAKVEIEDFIEERRQSDVTQKLREISLNGGNHHHQHQQHHHRHQHQQQHLRTCSQDCLEDPELACNHLRDCLTNLLTELDVDVMDLDANDSILSSPVSPPIGFRDISPVPMAITSSSESASASVSPLIGFEKSDHSDSCTSPNSSPCLNHRDTASFNSVDIELVNTSSTTSLAKYNQRESPIANLISNYHRNSYYDNNDEVCVNLLTVHQIQKIIDYYNPAVIKSASEVFPGNSVFGCEIDLIEKSNGGLTLPPFIENALIYLVRYGVNSVGIFRKSGVKARINALRQKLEELSSGGKPVNFSTLSYNSAVPGEEYCVYDIADMVKSWLRELKPRPLICKEIIQTFKNTTKRENLNFTLSIKLISMLSDAQRDVLQIVLQFLSWFATNSSVNQMNSHNLAICLTPSLCECVVSHFTDGNIGPPVDPNGVETEFLYDAQKCLEYLINNCDVMSVVSLNSLPLISNNEFSQKSSPTKDLNPSNGGNLMPPRHKSSIVITASPTDILRRILYQRNLFDPLIVEWSILEENPSENHDVFSFKIQSSVFLPVKSFTVQRRWRFITTDPQPEPVLGSKSENFISSIILEETGSLYASTWNINVLGEGKSVVQHSIAVDLRGHSYEWYEQSFPDIHDWQLCSMNQSFLVDFIETKDVKSSKV